MARRKNSGKRGSIARSCAQSVNLNSALRVRQFFEERTQEETLATRKMRPQRSMGLGEKCRQAQKQGQGYVPLSYRSMGHAGTLFEKARGARICG